MTWPTWERPEEMPIGDTRTTYRLTSLEALRAAMVANDYMSGRSLARAAGVGVSTVNHLVHGRRNTASAATVRAIRGVLGRDARELFVLEKSTVPVDRRRAAA